MQPKKIQESGAAGKPGETNARATSVAAKAPGGAAEQQNLTADGMAALLKAEFASEREAGEGEGVRPKPAKPITPKGESENGEQNAPEEGGEQNANAGAGEGEGEHQEGAGEGAELTAEQAAEAVATAAARVQELEDSGADAAEVEAARAELQTAQEAVEALAAAGEAGGEAELPPELQQAIEQWEEASGGELPPVLQTLVERRINRAVAQRDAEKERADQAEQRATAAEARMQELESAGGAAAAPVVGTMTEKQLEEVAANAERFLADAEAYLDDTATPQERERIERYMERNQVDATGLKRSVREMSRYVTTQLPQQQERLRQFRTQEKAFEPEAKKYFPWLDNKAAPEYAMAQEVFKTIPDLKQRTPAHRLVLGVYVLGLKQFNAMKAAQKAGGKAGAAATATNGRLKVKLPVKAPVKAPVAGAAAPAARVNGKRAAEDQVRSEFNKRPTAEGVARLFKMGLHEA